MDVLKGILKREHDPIGIAATDLFWPPRRLQPSFQAAESASKPNQTLNCSGASNPDHAYEFHPAMSMKCGSDDFSFGSMLRAFPGLRNIQPSSADGCIRTRTLKVRFKNNRYEFQESGGANCANFAIVRVSHFDFDWSFAIDGGHYTFATVTADGHHTGKIGLYTFTDSDIDTWLRDAIGAGGMGNTTKTIHGVFTYDWESIYLTLVDSQGNLRKPTQWTSIEFPLALIAYGENTAPF